MRRNLRRLLPVLMGGGDGREELPDEAFSFLPFGIWDDEDGTFSIGKWDISAQVPRTGGTYYVSKTGNDTTGDGSENAPWLTLVKANTALAGVANACVVIGEGRYGFGDGSLSNNINRSYIGDGDVIKDGYVMGAAWELTLGQTNTYQSTGFAANCGNVFDYGTLDVNGDPTPYTLKTSIAEVEAAEGSFWYNGGSVDILYVHALGHGSPDADVRPQYIGATLSTIVVDNVNMYIENIKSYQATLLVSNASAANTGKIYVKGCKFMLNALIQNNGYTMILQNCQNAHGTGPTTDLFIAQTSYTIASKTALIDCTYWDVGQVGGTSNNCYSHHAGISVIINGDYSNTYGPCIANIQGGYSWLLGVNAHHSLSASNNYSFFFQNAGAWMDRCISSSSIKDVGGGETVYTRDCTLPATSDATLIEY